MSQPATERQANAATTIVLRATREESLGAQLKVAGLTVFERSVRQLGRSADVHVILAADGTIPLPATLPANFEIRQLDVGNEIELAGLAQATSATAVIGADVVRLRPADFSAGLRVADQASRLHAEDAIFADLLRGDLGFIARHVNKKISFRITRHLLCRLPITPNQVTLIAAAIGLCGCWAIASGGRVAMVLGFFLAQAQSILDGCDGELARVRFQQSRIGEWLDTIVDDMLNLALIASLGVGMVHAGAGWFAAVVAGAALGMCAFYNLVSYRELIRQRLGGELIKIHWKVTRGRDVKSMLVTATPAAGASVQRLLFNLGRRDTFVFAWFLLSIVGLFPVALLWAFLVAATYFTIALTQVLAADAPA